MFSATVMCGKSPTRWKAYPMWRRRAGGGTLATSSPSTSTVPAVGSIKRLIILSVVVLPQPEPPSSTSSSPSATVSERPSTATVSP